MTSLNAIQGAGAAGETNRPSGTAGAQPTTDMFLKLLVAQLKTQNPLEPQKGTEFITQLAQFNTLEQLINIRAELQAIRQGGGMTSGSPPAGGPPSPGIPNI